MQCTILISEAFDRWLKELKYAKGAAAIARRIKRAESGNFGMHRSVGDGLSEMKIDVGPGYRVLLHDQKAFCRFCPLRRRQIDTRRRHQSRKEARK